MEIHRSVEDGALVVAVRGELDLHTARELKRAVDEALQDGAPCHLVLDMEGVSFIDSSGLGAILGRYRQVSALGGRMALANVDPQVGQLLELSGVSRIIGVHPSRGSALRGLARRGGEGR